MTPPLTVETQTNPDTSMVHITKLSVPGALHQAFCGYETRDEQPTEQNLESTDEKTCTTCLDIYLRKNPDNLSDERINELRATTNLTPPANE